MKTYISTGIVTNTLLFLRYSQKMDCYDIGLHMQIHEGNTPLVNLISFAKQCGWIEVKDNGFIISSRGVDILKRFDGYSIDISVWREILYSYIVESQPVWAKRIPSGRKEAFLFMNNEEKRCFLEAGLMETPANKEVVEWWDNVSEQERIHKSERLIKVGREGERLTIDFERKRTGRSPIWQSIETNLVGYDIISSKDSNAASGDILIEVKASTCSISDAKWVLSRNEWEIANYSYNKNRYFFYLWILGTKNKLAILNVDDVKKHVPIDGGIGVWKDVEIPYLVFESHFINVV